MISKIGQWTALQLMAEKNNGKNSGESSEKKL
jgi:hypothetical protein